MIYFDNASTTKVDDRVLKKMLPYYTEYYGNANSKYYDIAEYSKQAIATAKLEIANMLGVVSEEIYFNSGATEGNNHVLKAFVEMYSKRDSVHIITTSIEHSSILDTCKYLEEKGVEITYLDVNKYGQINLEDLSKSIKDNTILCSIGYVNSEIGCIQNMKAIGELCKKNRVYLHSDITQAIGKLSLDLKNIPNLRFATFSAHKIYGPTGIGALVTLMDEDGTKIKLPPLIHGGSQEKNLRSGTSATALIVGFGEACRILKNELNSMLEHYKMIDSYFTNILRDYPDEIIINNSFPNRVSGLINLQFVDVNAQLLLKNAKDIFAASTGSACSISKPSYVLKAIGLDETAVSQSIRLSLGKYNSLDDIDEFVSKIL